MENKQTDERNRIFHKQTNKPTHRSEPSIKVLEWQFIGKGETAQKIISWHMDPHLEDKIRPLAHTKYKN